MQITYKTTKEDFIKAIKLYYLNSLYKICIIFIIATVCIFIFNEENKYFLYVFLLILFFFVILIFFLKFKKFKKNLNHLLEDVANFSSKETFIIKKEGFSIISDNSNDEKIFTWESIKSTFSNNKYYLIILHNEKFILINKTNVEQLPMLSDIIDNIEKNKTIKTIPKNNKLLYFFGLLGLIPNIGLIVGIILSLFGIIRKDAKLIIIGIVNILFTILFWFVLNIIDNSEIIKNPLNKKISEITQSNLNDLVLRIEYYKSLKGVYPDNLKQIKNKNSFIVINEIFEDYKNTELYYKKINKTYILKSYGPDKVINTNDDIYPNQSDLLDSR